MPKDTQKDCQTQRGGEGSHQAVGVSQANRSVREGREREGKVFNSFILLYREKLCFLGDISLRIKLQTKPPGSQTLCPTQLK